MGDKIYCLRCFYFKDRTAVYQPACKKFLGKTKTIIISNWCEEREEVVEDGEWRPWVLNKNNDCKFYKKLDK